MWRGLCSIMLVVPSACAREDADRRVLHLSEGAEPIYALMKWEDVSAPPSCADAAGLSGIDAAVDPVGVEAAATALAGDLLERFELDPLQGMVNIETTERDIVPGPDLTEEQALRDGVTAVLSAMGATADQIALELSETTVIGGAPGEEPTVEVIDKTVRVQRGVLGLEVADGGNARFERSGPLIRMYATWHRFDYDASTLCVDGIATEEEVMAALAELIAAEGFEIEPTTVELDVGTFYRAMDPVDPTSDTWTLRLVGYAALIDSRGGTIPSFEYYLDDGTSLAD